LLDAARDLFAVEGFEIPLEQIAAHAGVSRATLHRHFVTREELAMEISAENIEQVEQRAATLSGVPGGFEQMLGFMFDMQLRTQALIPLLLQSEEKTHGDLSRRTLAAVQPLLEEAIAEGKVRDQVTPLDIKRVIVMISSTANSPDLVQRAVELKRSWWLLRPGIFLPND
jgi:AcrR family transcriptional regulator